MSVGVTLLGAPHTAERVVRTAGVVEPRGLRRGEALRLHPDARSRHYYDMRCSPVGCRWRLLFR